MPRNTTAIPQVNNPAATECFRFIIEFKQKNLTRLSDQLEDPNTAPKTYWSVLNWFFHNKKIPNILPTLVNGEVVSNFSEKAELFNSHFASQCTNSKLPSLGFKIKQRLQNRTLTDDDMSLVIENLKVDKAHGQNDISIRMIKLWYIYSTFVKINFPMNLNDGFFPDDWKKSNIVPRHKKESKTFIKKNIDQSVFFQFLVKRLRD